jgi:hypothetical protein
MAWEAQIRKGWATGDGHIAVMREYTGEIVLQVPPPHLISCNMLQLSTAGGKLRLGISYHAMEQRYRVATPGDPWMEVEYSRGLK